MVWPAIIGLALFILLIVILGFVFAATVLDIVINGVILYLIAIRMWAEFKKGRIKECTVAGIIALVVFFIKAKIFTYLWPVTNFLIVWFVLAQIAMLIAKLGKKRRKN
ncbi:MAG: hypothetical protein QXK08_03855 [Candidatus Woesearchaeota archaeon]